MRILMVPGIGGSDEQHWQTLWEQDLGPRAERIEPRSWDAPDQDDWLDAISRRAAADSVIVAHSLGCLAAATWLTRDGGAHVAGAFLVAPPDRDASEFPPPASSFESPRVPLPVPALVVASADDPYSSLAAAHGLARSWGAQVVEVGARGHLNSASGLGSWDEGRAHLQAFLTGLGRAEPEGRDGAASPE